MPRATPTGVERHFDAGDIIVSKTDLKGVITYANRVFMEVAGFTEDELIGRPHSLIRHPDMPMAVFELLWDTLAAGEEIFAYVNNLCKNGDHYWVFAHVTPTFEGDAIVGYHSSRRVPDRKAVDTLIPIYRSLRELELAAPTKKEGLAASRQALRDFLTSKEVAYDELVFAL